MLASIEKIVNIFGSLVVTALTIKLLLKKDKNDQTVGAKAPIY